MELNVVVVVVVGIIALAWSSSLKDLWVPDRENDRAARRWLERLVSRTRFYRTL